MSSDHKRFNSIKFKSSILYSVILGVVLIALCLVNYVSLRNILTRNLDKTLVDEAIDVKSTLEIFEEIEDPYSISFNIPELDRMMQRYFPSKNKKIDMLRRWWEQESTKLGFKKRFVAVYDQQKNLLVDLRDKKDGPGAMDQNNTGFSTSSIVYSTVKLGSAKYRIINFPFKYEGFLYVIRIGTSLSGIEDILSGFIFYAAIAVTVIMMFTSFMGRLMAGRVLDPVNRTIKLLNEISHKDLSKRLDEQDAEVELQQMIDSLNAMLERLEKSFSQINEFSSHVAHELKTPLAVIKGEMEVALMSRRSAQEYKEVIEVCLEEADRQIKIVEDLLFIARVDYKKEIFNFEDMDISGFIKEVYEQFKVVADERHFELLLIGEINRPCKVKGDRVHLRRLLFNLLNNALKYSYKGSKIELGCEYKEDKVCISVKDYGRGISQQHLNRIFEKFYRAPGVDVNESFSCGLGLSIADAIARAHQGKIEVRSRPQQGTEFKVYLPI